MEIPDVLEIHPASHPSLEVHRAGFPLDHPYLEQCWTPLIGPSSVLALRHAAQLWQDNAPAVVATSELARHIGLGKGTGAHSPIARTLGRIVRFRFAEWTAPGALNIYSEVRPLRGRDLNQVPAWSEVQHERLLNRHLDSLGSSASRTPETPVEPPPTAPVAGSDRVAGVARQLDDFAAEQTRAVSNGIGR